MIVPMSIREFILSNVLPGAAYGATAVALSHPFDTLKTRQQASGVSSAFRAIKNAIVSEGPLVFYNGFVPALFGSMAFRSLPFIAYQSTSKALNDASDWFERHTTIRAFIAGATGGLLRSFVECPLEVMKVRQQVSVSWQWSYMYRGLAITALRNMSVISLFWGFADNARRWCDQIALGDATTSFIVGGGCSTLAWAMIYPLDVVKSRVQSQGGQSIRAVLTQLRGHKSGVGVFYAGLRAGLLRSVIANGGAFVVYDYTRKRLFDGE